MKLQINITRGACMYLGVAGRGTGRGRVVGEDGFTQMPPVNLFMLRYV